MSGTIRFHLDENVNNAIADGLRSLILIWEALAPEDMRNHLEFL